MIEGVRGTRSIEGLDAQKYEHIVEEFYAVYKDLGFELIKLPILEKEELFTRTTGEFTDIVTKQMYQFKDKGGRNLVLRPEGTAGVMRNFIEKKYKDQKKYIYSEQMYRYERPQKGRYREFHQVGAEIIGSNNNNASANCVEILRGSVNFLQNLNVEFSLIINTIGISEDRDKYMKTLEKYFYSNKSKLSDESVKRIDTNPLRILDSKEDSDIEVVSGAPSFKEFISNESLNHYSKIKSMLDKFDIEYTENEYLIRGLDYYNDFTFEMHPISKSGSQYALGGGGQYDNLSSLISNKQINGIGVAFGVDRLIELIEMDNTNNE